MLNELGSTSSGSATALNSLGPEQFAREMLFEMNSAWPNHKVFTFVNAERGADGPLRLLFREIVAMWHEFGAERTAEAVIQAIRQFEHPPRIAKLRECVPEPKYEGARADPDCPDCLGTSWKTIPAEGKRPQSVTKCDCWKKQRGAA